jgi:lipoyl(octanoyl) transferase
MAASEPDLIALRMGRLEYEPAWSLQQALQARLIDAKRSTPPELIPHLLLLVEHPPVYTLGKSGDRGNLLVDKAGLEKQGATFVHIDRGGDITYHGPGQLVGYPILDLDRVYRDIHRYLRDLEEAIIRTCQSKALSATRVPGRTGVWIGPDARGPERKIAAMGIRCSRWVTMHGFAFNLNTELSRYDAIVPCGIRDRGVTSLADELGSPVDEPRIQDELLGHFADIFGFEIRLLESGDATPFIEAYLDKDRVVESGSSPFTLS